MDLIVTHNNADFDALGSAVAAHKIYPDARILLPGSQEQAVRRFMSLAKDMIRIENEKTCDLSGISRLILVDTRHMSRIGAARELLSRKTEVHIYDHHPRMADDIKGDIDMREDVGATITIMIDLLKRRKYTRITPLEATIMLLGVYEETGSLTYRSTTRRDVDAVSFLLGKGANLQAVSAYLNRNLSEEELAFLVELINRSTTHPINGVDVAFTYGEIPDFRGELGAIVHKLDEVENYPVLFALFKSGRKVRVLARSRDPRVDVNRILQKIGGGGHPTAAGANLACGGVDEARDRILALCRTMIRVSVYARDIMTSPVRTIPVSWSVEQAEKMLNRFFIKGAPCLDSKKLAGIITKGDIAKAVRHGLGHSRVTGYMRRKVVTIRENAPVHVIQKIMFEKDIGRLPVIRKGKVVGIVTRTDVLKKIYGEMFRAGRKDDRVRRQGRDSRGVIMNLGGRMEALLPPAIMKLLRRVGKEAEAAGYMSFAVGGFVRDVMLGVKNFDLDIVVDGNAIEFGKRLERKLSGRLVVHRKFGTATLVMGWPKGLRKPPLAGDRFKMDLATARKEKYERPAALPKVEFSSLKDDLSRRDFSINAMAVSLNRETFGQLIDFFSGLRDLKAKKVRVLHEASFIDDPTRIFRAVRFEQRFCFRIDAYTEKLIKTAVKEKMFSKTENQRIRDELILILKENEPLKALARMNELEELKFIAKGIRFSARLKRLFTACRRAYDFFIRECPGKRKPDLYVMYLMALTDNLGLKELEALCSKFVFRRSERLRLISYHKNMSGVLKALSRTASMKPSGIYSVLEPLSYEAILVIMAGSPGATVKKRIANFLVRYNSVRIKTRGGDIKNMGLREGPHYGEMLTGLLYAKLDGRVKTKKEEIRYLKRLCAKGKREDRI
ncbi:MAG: CBS domain-containing protein [Candidatus Omnitrophota bacterium]